MKSENLLYSLENQNSKNSIKGTKLICDNRVALFIASSPVSHLGTKYIEIDCHFVSEEILPGEVITDFVSSSDQFVDMFTMSFKGSRVHHIYNKLGSYGIYAPAGGVC